MKKRIPGQRGFQYLPTESCRELLPVIRSLAEWGMCWTRSNLSEMDYDVDLLMLYLKRSIVPGKLVGNETVIHFHFTDIKRYPYWWIVVHQDEIDLCVNDTGKNIDVWFATGVKTMVDIWMGDLTYRQAIRNGSLKLVGNSALIHNVTDWMRNSEYADLPAASKI